ncbi:MAG TPA: hypothetical protein V6D12_14175 [Candidatus Obscuribacterales bacterium]
MKVLWVYLIIAILLLGNPVQADVISPRTNVYASWVNVTAAHTITFPYVSRDIMINNGSANGICVNIRGGSVDASCRQDTDDSIQLPGNSSLNLTDFITSSISFAPLSASASPVSVVVTY